MKIILLLTSLMLVSCGANKIEPIYGKTTVDELTQMVGEPIKEEDIAVKDSKILHFANGDKYQVKNNVVQNSFLGPGEDESKLIYWQHAFKDCDVTTEKLSNHTDGHTDQELLMKCDSLGVGVIYNERSNFITRVFKYEKK